MTKKNWFLLGALAVLASAYVFYFTDWFRSRPIQIFHTCRANRLTMIRHPRANAEKPATIPVLFGLDARYQLTEIKVCLLSAWATNHEALPLWHLVSLSNSIPIKQFNYGQPIRGMIPAIPGTRAEPLDPNVTYRLFLQAGRAKGEHDFSTKPAS